MRGRSIRLSPMRRFICDLLWASASVPTVPVQRPMNLALLARARTAHPLRPSWAAIFVKAYARVATELPELRRAYVKFPWPRLYEYPVSAAAITVERDGDGEKAVFIGRIGKPETLDLVDVDRRMRGFREIPIDRSREFRRALALSRLPLPLRRALWWVGLNVPRQRWHSLGTFALSVYSGLGAESLHPLSPATVTLNYGVIAPEGDVDVRLIYDHRVMDGATVARALGRLEAELTGPILDELGQPPVKSKGSGMNGTAARGA
jgi:hypothetical protein